MKDDENREQALAETKFACALRRQLETTAQPAPRRRYRVAIAVVVIVAGVAMIAGIALAGGFSSDTSTLPKPPLPAESVYPTNASGQTYGSEKALTEEPDLVAVQATNGEHGYCLKTDLEATPSSSGAPQTREEAEASMDAGLRGRTIPVYKSDGVTKIGVFQLAGPGTTAQYGTRDGSVVTKTCDKDLNIIVTKVAPDGTTTVETRTLDGTVTKKTLTPTEAARLKNAPSPTPSPTPTHRPDKPAWLLERMSSLARAAGASRVTARWELQCRYYLKRLEGDSWPTSEYAQWEDVWLVIMRGDFSGGSWRYWLLDPVSHVVISRGQSDRPFDTSGHDITPELEGPITIDAD